jgi:S-adenosylmethionine/arginine decarboxylase-like enzyme
MARYTRKRKASDRCWGYHLIVNAAHCDPAALRSKSTIAAFAKELVAKIDMVAYGPPRIVMFGTGSKKGYTLVQLIETSNITAHFVEEFNDIYLDIFSCKPFAVADAMAVFRAYFKPGRVDTHFMKRQAHH